MHLKQKFKANSSGSHSVRLNAVGFRELTVDDSVRHYYDGKHLDLSWLEPFTRHEERVVEIKYKVIQPITVRPFLLKDPISEYCDSFH